MSKHDMSLALERGQTGLLPAWYIDGASRPSGAPTCSTCKRLMWNCLCEHECETCGEPFTGPFGGECGDCAGGGE